MKKVIGIDLGGTSIKFGIFDEVGNLEEQWSISTNISDAGCHIVPDMIDALNQKLLSYDTSEIAGIGMGSPGSVDLKKMTVTGAYNLNWTECQEVGKKITEATGLPFVIDNDANAAALGERWLGAGENESDLVFITLGTGVGGGIISKGELIHGVAGSAGEIGHIVVETQNAFQCTCGSHGCLETVASATGIVRLAHQFAAENPTLEYGSIETSKDIFAAAKAGNEFSLKVVEKVSMYLGLACGNLGNILNPESIIIGGGVSGAGEFLRERIEKYFFSFTFPTVRQTTKIRLAKLGSDAGIAGAAGLARKFL